MKELTPGDISKLDRMIEQAVTVTVTAHIHPDGDAAGSTAALVAYLAARGKDAAIVLPDAFPDNISFAAEGIAPAKILPADTDAKAAKERITKSDLIFCVDCNGFSRTGDILEPALKAQKARKILIDHHIGPEQEDFDLVFSTPEVSSASELLYHILMSLPDIGHDAQRLPSISRDAIMTGMTTDTNNFANSVFPTTFEMASRLIAAGVDRDAIISRLYQSAGENRLRLMGSVLRCMKVTPEGIAYIILRRATMKRYGIHEGDTEGFVNMPLSIKNVRMSIFLKEDKGHFRVSLRSKKGTSARLTASTWFHGGGHEQASGGRLFFPGDISTPSDAESYILKVIAHTGK
ncbi:MAG: DHH family phosphoesterase [Bacteroidales bacterium]|nr:DHH family phosphoesterase [Bacteroidales bacterium]